MRLREPKVHDDRTRQHLLFRSMLTACSEHEISGMSVKHPNRDVVYLQ
jgi:hypothetical protein